MNEYKYQQRRKKRYDRCCIAGTLADGTDISRFCPCGSMNPPPKKVKKRIVRRFLSRELRNIIQEV